MLGVVHWESVVNCNFSLYEWRRKERDGEEGGREDFHLGM